MNSFPLRKFRAVSFRKISLNVLVYKRLSALGGVNKLYRAACRYGVKRSQVLRWLQRQQGYTLQRPARKRFRRNGVVVNDTDSQWRADLVDMQSLSRRYKCLLTCIDILSK